MERQRPVRHPVPNTCLLYTSDAADERSSVDLGGRRIIKKKKKENVDIGDSIQINKSHKIIHVKCNEMDENIRTSDSMNE